MNRRQLLTALAGVALTTSDLWKPDRSIFLPPRGGWLPAEPGWLVGTEAGFLVPPEIAHRLFIESEIATVFIIPRELLEMRS